MRHNATVMQQQAHALPWFMMFTFFSDSQHPLSLSPSLPPSLPPSLSLSAFYIHMIYMAEVLHFLVADVQFQNLLIALFYPLICLKIWSKKWEIWESPLKYEDWTNHKGISRGCITNDMNDMGWCGLWSNVINYDIKYGHPTNEILMGII